MAALDPCEPARRGPLQVPRLPARRRRRRPSIDAVRAGDIPKKKANDLGIIYSVWLDPAVLAVPKGKIDHAALFTVHREATAKVIKKAMNGEPDIDWLLDNQDKVEHYFHQQGLEGKI